MVIALCAVLGLLVGSFLNVVIARVPQGRSVVRPGSACPSCGRPIGPRDNVPVVSWLLLRGRSRCCDTPIPARYPLVEAGTAVAFGLVAWWLGPQAGLPAFLYLAAASIALALIDIDVKKLPYVIVAPSYPVGAVLLGAASWAHHDWASVRRAAIGAVALFAFYRLIHQIKPAAMGYGDVRLAGVLGMYLGWLGWGTLVAGAFFGFVVGGFFGVALIVLARGTMKSQIPYGPYMLLGAWLGAVWGEPVADAYLRLAGLR